MIPVAFSYHRATSVDDAIARISSNPDAKLLGGGHSLVPAMKLRLSAPSELVDITGIEELKHIEIGDTIKIGALVTYNDLHDCDTLAEIAPIFRMTIPHLGDQQVRARGTFGGSIAHADPAADLTAVLLALGGTIHVQGPAGSRSIPVEEYFLDLWTTALAPDELLTSVEIPLPSTSARMTYVKHRHPASGYAVVGVAAVVDDHGARVTITGATSRPEHMTGVEDAISSGINAESMSQAYDRATEGLEINGDLYADVEFRTHLVAEYVKTALVNLSK